MQNNLVRTDALRPPPRREAAVSAVLVHFDVGKRGGGMPPIENVVGGQSVF